jgi:hypothetical protein
VNHRNRDAARRTGGHVADWSLRGFGGFYLFRNWLAIIPRRPQSWAPLMAKSQIELEYGVRRVAYLTAGLAEAYSDLATSTVRMPIASRITFLLMVRNLDEFFFGRPKYPNDLRFSHFGWSHWQPNSSQRVPQVDRVRLDRTIAHVVDTDPGHFGTRTELKAFGRPRFELACEFLRECRRHPDITIDPKAAGYLREINELIPRIEEGYRTLRIPPV